ncbi:hypothetical protein Tco_0899967 [Tanacetum coccineum]
MLRRIGSIMYAVRCTRPDVAFAQNLCCRFQQNPNEIHLTSVKTILKDLRNTKDMVLVYGAKTKDELKVSCYVDATVDWKSVKQSTTTMSSSKAEYIAAAEASMEAAWMRKFIDGLGGVMPSNKRPMEMLCDNEPALAIVRDLKVHIDDNVADPFTKPMSFSKHFEHAMKIGIVNANKVNMSDWWYSEEYIKMLSASFACYSMRLNIGSPPCDNHYGSASLGELHTWCKLCLSLDLRFEIEFVPPLEWELDTYWGPHLFDQLFDNNFQLLNGELIQFSIVNTHPKGSVLFLNEQYWCSPRR